MKLIINGMFEKQEDRGSAVAEHRSAVCLHEEHRPQADEEIHRLSYIQWLSFKERTVDALALGADEGRNELR